MMASNRVSRMRNRGTSSISSSRESSPPAPQCKDNDVNYKEMYDLKDLELQTTLGTGTFGRVVLAKHSTSKSYFALKIMQITEVIRLKQVEHVQSEKAILQQVDSPFIVKMYWAQHDDRFLYMLLEFVCGGELFSYLRNAGRFNNNTSKFYAAEIVSAIDYLHSMDIVYRDLKPENLLLDIYGHLKLTDFGFAKKLQDRTWTLCGTPEYLAPEIIQSKGHNRAVDWWALGILIYEMLVGYPPFYDDSPFGIYEKILAGRIEWPRFVDLIAKDLIRKLLIQDRTRRIGNMKNAAVDIKSHRWFKGLNWDEVLQLKLTPPNLPVVSFAGDTSNFVPQPMAAWVQHINNNIQPPIVPHTDSAGDTQNFDDYPGDDWKTATRPTIEQHDLFEDF